MGYSLPTKPGEKNGLTLAALRSSESWNSLMDREGGRETGGLGRLLQLSQATDVIEHVGWQGVAVRLPFPFGRSQAIQIRLHKSQRAVQVAPSSGDQHQQSNQR